MDERRSPEISTIHSRYSHASNHGFSFLFSENGDATIPHLQHCSTDTPTLINFVEREKPTKLSEIHTSSSHAPRPLLQSAHYLAHVWRWELAIWLLGTIGFIANIALLVRFNNKEQSSWKSNVQITAFVAALAQLSQSALLVPIGSCIGQSKWIWLEKKRKAIDIDRFDLASRGPDGAIRLLWHLRLQPNLVWLGALSMLLMLAFPTFVQQSVAINISNIPFSDQESSYVQRALEVLGGLPEFDDKTRRTGADPDLIATAQALLGVYMDPANITGTCSTGRCTWDPYKTLSMCVTTEDATAELVQGNRTVNGTTLPPIIPGAGKTPPITENTTLYTYIGGKSEWRIPDNILDPPYTNEVTIPDIVNLYVIFYDPCRDESTFDGRYNDIHNIENWTALKAQFHLCAQTFNTSFETVWDTKILNSTRDMKWHYSPGNDDRGNTTNICQNANIPNVECSTAYYSGSACPASGDGSGNNCINPWVFGKFCTNLDAPNDLCTDPWLMDNIERSFRTTFNISAERDPASGAEIFDSSPSKWTPAITMDFRGDSPMLAVADCTAQPRPKFDKRMQSIAASLSIAMRGRDDAKHPGTAWRPAAIIQVDFVWLTMPLIVYAIITIFLFATISQTRTAPPWKSSSLALLQCTDARNNLLTTEQLKIRARTTEIRLQSNSESWHLVESSKHEQEEGGGKTKPG